MSEFTGPEAHIWEQRLTLEDQLLELERTMSVGNLAIHRYLEKLILQANALRESDPDYDTNRRLFQAMMQDKYGNS